MRKKTINIITAYQSIGALMNAIALLILSRLEMPPSELVLTITIINIGYILVSRDVSIKHEQIKSKGAHSP